MLGLSVPCFGRTGFPLRLTSYFRIIVARRHGYGGVDEGIFSTGKTASADRDLWLRGRFQDLLRFLTVGVVG